ncbi:MAG TPA: hypothetical protein VHV47_08200 [Opitutaceae bacterium]|jgi:hypothetical protein|nr:hypothetical protein [Opitutaceae bacterium]
MSRLAGFRILGIAGLLAVLALGRLEGVTVADLLNEAKLNPHRFANHFESFDYEYADGVQPGDVFLSRQKGDCDDYAILADYVLGRRGFATRLIHVNLVGRTAHDICDVAQARGYLDYNLRSYFRNVQGSGRTLREIADKVADSFAANWTSISVYSYTYDEDVKHLTMTVVKTDPPSEDADRAAAR